ncbi:unnamed protein product [Symbiodinium sp. CCMP2592]|nr:unnamed protein product [Symbiodinium sp. CCMP2592]
MGSVFSEEAEEHVAPVPDLQGLFAADAQAMSIDESIDECVATPESGLDSPEVLAEEAGGWCTGLFNLLAGEASHAGYVLGMLTGCFDTSVTTGWVEVSVVLPNLLEWLEVPEMCALRMLSREAIDLQVVARHVVETGGFDRPESVIFHSQVLEDKHAAAAQRKRFQCQLLHLRFQCCWRHCPGLADGLIEKLADFGLSEDLAVCKAANALLKAYSGYLLRKDRVREAVLRLLEQLVPTSGIFWLRTKLVLAYVFPSNSTLVRSEWQHRRRWVSVIFEILSQQNIQKCKKYCAACIRVLCAGGFADYSREELQEAAAMSPEAVRAELMELMEKPPIIQSGSGGSTGLSPGCLRR